MRERTFVSIQLGIRLRDFREAAGKSVRDVQAARKVRSTAQLSRLENGYHIITTVDAIGGLCDFYGVAPEEKFVTQQMFLKAEDDQEWWEPYSEVMFRDISMLFTLERHASKIYVYDLLVNGLFQTKKYARDIHSQADPETIARKVEL